MANAINANQLVVVEPGVLGTGGNALDMIGLMLSKNNVIPNGIVSSFPSAAAVGNVFGTSSPEYIDATKYFTGFTGCFELPESLWIANYPLVADGAFLQGAPSLLSLAQLQALGSGNITVQFSGVPFNSSVNLSSATSFSQAAQLLTTGFGIQGPIQGTATGSQGFVSNASGAGSNVTINSLSTGVVHVGSILGGSGNSAVITGQSSGATGGTGVYTLSQNVAFGNSAITGTSTTVDVTNWLTGSVAVGAQETGSSVAANSFITALGTGTGNTAGTYISTVAQQYASTTLTFLTPTVAFNSLSNGFDIVSNTTGTSSTISFATGTLATGLGLTALTGAVTSQGAAAAVPATYMNNLLNYTQDFATFWAAFDLDQGNGNAMKLAMAEWNNTQNNAFLYIVDDMDITPTLSTQATSSLGYLVGENGLNLTGTAVIYENAANHTAAAMAGMIGAIAFDRPNGRTNLAYRTQNGLVYSVTNGTVAKNLIANGYNFYGSYSTRNQGFQLIQKGTTSGPFKWIDTYVNQIWLNAALQLQLLETLTQALAVPYSPTGMAILRAACMVPINNALSFGAIVPGVPIDGPTAAILKADAGGVDIAPTITSQGYYLQILLPTAQTIANRGSPIMTLWYADGGSVDTISLASVAILG